MRKPAIGIALLGIITVSCGAPAFTATAPVQPPVSRISAVPIQDVMEPTTRPTRTAWPTRLPIPTATPMSPPLRLDMEIDWLPENASAIPIDESGETWLVANSSIVQSRQVTDGALNWEHILPMDPNDERGLVSGITTSHQGDRVAVGYRSGEIYVLSTTDGSLIRSVMEKGMILGLVFSPNGSFLYTMGRPYDGFGQVAFWALDGGQDGTVDEGGNSFEPLGDTGLIVTNQLSVFDLIARQRVQLLSEEYRSMNAIDVSPNGQWLSANDADEIFAWHISGTHFESVDVPAECMPRDLSWIIGIVPISNQGILFTRMYQNDVGPERALVCDLGAQRYIGEIANVERLFIMADDRVVTKTRGDPTLRIWSWLK